MDKKLCKLIIYTDGGARGNPGPAGIGVVVYDENRNLIDEVSEYIGETTNNQAEYQALLAGSKKAKAMGATAIDFFLDSELIVRQMKGEYKIKEPALARLFVLVYNELASIKTTFTHVRREFNKEADKLVNLALDKALK